MKKGVKFLLGSLLGSVVVCGVVVGSYVFQKSLIVKAVEYVENISEDETELNSDEIVEDVISLAKSKIGCQYVQSVEGRNGDNTFDSSGFVRYLYKQTTGVDIGLWTGQQEEVLKDYEVSMDEIQPGDLLFSNGHVALYIGDGQVIHASNPKPYPEGGVKVSNVYKHLNRAYRPIDFIANQQ